MPPSSRKNGSLTCLVHEASARYEAFSAMDNLASRRRLQATHWSAAGHANASDSAVMAFAAANATLSSLMIWISVPFSW
jgi:hypothetical protein